MKQSSLEFERPILELEQKISELKKFSQEKGIDVTSELKNLEKKLEGLRHQILQNLTAWQRVQIARHPQRPYTLDYIRLVMEEFIELHGDRRFGDDQALVGGFAKMEDHRLMVLGHQKGRDLKERQKRSFGCAHPEGYRKALRLMQMAEKAKTPILALIDTPGAYPGVGAEERGQAEAIAVNLREMSQIKVPIVAAVIGEGGSGGALGIGVADRILILENAYYSVISPEGCASILWREKGKMVDAAEALKLTAYDLLSLGIVDEIIPEPIGGAHHDYEITARHLRKTVQKHLLELIKMGSEELIETRYQKFRKMGVFTEFKPEG
ncbi:MAG: acetyl-CoA carboxylase carboxyltransferase subunit alpha [Chlamydiae bacterium]|nr:acetyl-CoA carboxylase carboxyltransferase subunit alpha [Chlamydiota bacterium]MBI3276424.1 acetyl-CoA carboxylase carboxyltransferase subunit alpha [Chlamydiota bacterium]